MSLHVRQDGRCSRDNRFTAAPLIALVLTSCMSLHVKQDRKCSIDSRFTAAPLIALGIPPVSLHVKQDRRCSSSDLHMFYVTWHIHSQTTSALTTQDDDLIRPFLNARSYHSSGNEFSLL